MLCAAVISISPRLGISALTPAIKTGVFAAIVVIRVIPPRLYIARLDILGIRMTGVVAIGIIIARPAILVFGTRRPIAAVNAKVAWLTRVWRLIVIIGSCARVMGRGGAWIAAVAFRRLIWFSRPLVTIVLRAVT
jgi:hypothetical protein